MPVSMIPIETPSPVLPRSCQAATASTTRAAPVLPTVFGVIGRTAVTPGSVPSAAWSAASAATATPV
ncbi:hypothetical protein A7K94_0220730, partial [Modestobacter sp. VKM Ac-2676]